MGTLPQGNPRLPEDINRSHEHPLPEFFKLLLAVMLGLALLAFTIGILSHWLAPFVPFSWEASASVVVDEAVEDEFGETEFEPRQQQALQALGEKLLVADAAAASSRGDDRGEEIPPQAFTFRLVHSDMANAFASFGGQVFVTDALVESLSSENALAMVLAHEIAHVRHRDPIKSASSALVLQLTMAALLGYSGEGGLRQLLSSTGLVTMTSFSRDMERESDERALATLVQRYGHSRGADEFFRQVAETEDELRWLEFTETHPDTRERLANIEQSIRDSVPDPTRPPALTPLPDALVFSVVEK
jgi:Zn-dependent protease with chaperone function